MKNRNKWAFLKVPKCQFLMEKWFHLVDQLVLSKYVKASKHLEGTDFFGFIRLAFENKLTQIYTNLATMGQNFKCSAVGTQYYWVQA